MNGQTKTNMKRITGRRDRQGAALPELPPDRDGRDGLLPGQVSSVRPGATWQETPAAAAAAASPGHGPKTPGGGRRIQERRWGIQQRNYLPTAAAATSTAAAATTTAGLPSPSEATTAHPEGCWEQICRLKLLSFSINRRVQYCVKRTKTLAATLGTAP